MKWTTCTALVFVTAAVLSYTTASAAEKITVYNGSYCKPFSGSQSADFEFGNRITNISSLPRNIVCPVLLTDGFINQGASIWVYVSARLSTDIVRCTFSSLDAAGMSVESQASERAGPGADSRHRCFRGNRG